MPGHGNAGDTTAIHPDTEKLTKNPDISLYQEINE
jgi:hypothetical protein